MQAADDKELLEKNKDILLKSYLEKGVSDTKITTMWKLANAFGMKFSDFAGMIEAELPPDFDFYK